MNRVEQGRTAKRIGVLGTFVRDRIWHPEGEADRPVEQWGGIAYSLAAMAASCPPGWSVVPLAHIGRDLHAEAELFLDSLPHLETRAGIEIVEGESCRVELYYHDGAERSERFTGEPRSWTIEALLPFLAGLDALYVNFISGFELDLEAALALRDAVSIPLYADLHSLFLGPPGEGPRAPRLLPEATRWLSCFDIVQLNESELALLCSGEGAPEELIDCLEGGPRLAAVTRGRAGATLAYRPGENLVRSPVGDREGPRQMVAPVEVHLEEVPLEGPASAGDPTGCGDIWGSVVFTSLLAGRSPRQAALRGHRAARARMSVDRIDDLAPRIGAALRSR